MNRIAESDFYKAKKKSKAFIGAQAEQKSDRVVNITKQRLVSVGYIHDHQIFALLDDDESSTKEAMQIEDLLKYFF